MRVNKEIKIVKITDSRNFILLSIHCIIMRTLYNKIATLLLLTCLVFPASGSGWEDPPSLRDRLFFGGNFGLSFGDVTSIIVSPIAGFHFTPRLAGGLGIRYEYYKNNYPGFSPYDTHIYGGSVFSRFMIVKNMGEVIGFGGLGTGLFIQGEYETLSLEREYFDFSAVDPEGRFFLHSVLVGGGIYQPIGERAGFLITVLWNLNESHKSIYSNPVIRIGFTF
jgi:hypothetical protein